MIKRFLILVLMALPMLVQPALAVNPDEVLDDPALEARARVLSAKLRCLVCQNQSIDDSDAQLARDLRVIVRERLVAGDTNDQVLDYLVARYGEYVLLKPRFGAHTIILWVSPFVILAAGALFLLFKRRRRTEMAVAAMLNDDEEAALKALLERDQDK